MVPDHSCLGTPLAGRHSYLDLGLGCLHLCMGMDQLEDPFRPPLQLQVIWGSWFTVEPLLSLDAVRLEFGLATTSSLQLASLICSLLQCVEVSTNKDPVEILLSIRCHYLYVLNWMRSEKRSLKWDQKMR